MISLATSKITKQVRKNINKALDDNRIGGGSFIKKFEKLVSDYNDAKYGIATCNGTMADIVALAAIKALHPDKNEVIVPALTFIAHTNAVLVNGLKPVFVDVDENCLMDIDSVEITDKTLAVMPANLLGKEIDMRKLRCKVGDIPIIEDNCEAYGLRSKYADVSVYSFFPSHTITTGEGGMVLTDNEKIAEYCRACRNHGRLNTDILNMFHFPVFGLNGKMTNIEAAIGCAVASSADRVIKKRQENVEVYNKLLKKNWYALSPHCYPVWYETEEERDTTLVNLDLSGIEARKLFSCIPTVEYRIGGNYPMAEKLSRTGLFVPVHQDLTAKDIKKVCEIL